MKQTYKFVSSILKKYDVRGTVGKNLSEKDAYFMGKGYGTFLRNQNRKSCVVGYDGRRTSPEYAEHAIKGLRECGVDVVNIGMVPSPTVYWAMWHLNKDAGFIVTASHNPAEYNGFKMVTKSAPVWGDDILEIGKIPETGNYAEGNGTFEEIDIKEDYLNFIMSVFEKGGKELKVVWDAGNGVVGAVLDDLVARLPGTHKTIFSDVDPDFPNHHPDPSVAKNMELLAKEVVKGGYDYGVSFDGDGDRMGVVDGEGYVLFGDQLLVILARDYLKKNQGAKVMSEVKASQVLYDDIKKHGGVPVMGEVGHSGIKARMAKYGIKLAGETSGHIYYGANHNFDDALYASVKLLGIMSKSKETVAEIRKSLPVSYSTREGRINVGDDRKFEITKEVAERLKKAGVDFVDTDGVRANLKEGWWLLRGSNTEPDLTTRCESLTPEGLEIVKEDLKKQLKLSGIDANLDE